MRVGAGEGDGRRGPRGLTRAFQYAGARTVLASLWRVQDGASAELMALFYGYLKAGRTKDEALRQAQIDLIHATGSSAELSNPVHWAAWELIGGWK